MNAAARAVGYRLEAKGGDSEALVIVRGRDPEFFTTYSLKRLGEQSDAEKDDD